MLPITQTLFLPGSITPPPSPPLHVQDVVVEDKPQLDVQSLRINLNLGRGKCGSRTKTTGKPCNMPVKTEKVKVDSKLEALIFLTQSSPNLQTELYELAKVVHCGHHRGDKDLRYRVDKWIKAFPPGDSKLKYIASVEKQIEEVLGEASVHCAGINNKNKPCRSRMGGRKVQNFTKTVKEIMKPECYLNNAELEFFLQVLRENRFCSHHVESQGLKKVEIWKLAIINIYVKMDSRQPSSKTINTFIEDKTLGITRPGKEDRAPSGEMNTEVGARSPRTSVRSRSRSLTPALFWPEEYDTSRFNISAMSKRPDDYKSSFPEIQSILLTPLKKEERAEGFVYAYEVEGNKGFIKIGYTTRQIHNRHDEWSFNCNRRCLPIYPVASDLPAVPCAARVEALCHAELKHRNIQIDCSGCLKLHVEWFQISHAEAVIAIQKWSYWMRSTPYQPSQVKTSDEWTLPKEEKEKAKDISQFMKDLSCLQTD